MRAHTVIPEFAFTVVPSESVFSRVLLGYESYGYGWAIFHRLEYFGLKLKQSESRHKSDLREDGFTDL